MTDIAPEAGQLVRRVREHEQIEIPLQSLVVDGRFEIDQAVQQKGYFTFRVKGGSLVLQASGWIGFIPINDRLAIEVAPRAPISNLARLLAIGGFGPRALEEAARHYRHDPTELPSLRDFYSQALLSEVALIEALGRMREYTRREAVTTSPRGRFLMQAPETQRAGVGQSVTVRSSWFERTADVDVNRCMKMALFLLANGYARSRNLTSEQRRLARRLNAASALFSDASLDMRFGFLKDPVVLGSRELPATRAYYRAGLDIARTVVSNASVALDQPGADLRLPSLILSLEKVFESYVRLILRRELGGLDGDLSVEDGNDEAKKLLFDEEPSEDATPDIVVKSNKAKTLAVIDVKYKPAKGSPSRDDINQVIAYAASYRCDLVALVQPAARTGAGSSVRKLGTMGDLAIYQLVIDLSSDDLLAEERALAAGLLPLIKSAGAPEVASVAVPG